MTNHIDDRRVIRVVDDNLVIFITLIGDMKHFGLADIIDFSNLNSEKTTKNLCMAKNVQ